MQRLPDNPDRADDETTVTTCNYSMFASAQSPKALSLMTALALAAGRVEDAETWLIELIGAIVFTDGRSDTPLGIESAPRDTLRMS